MREMLHRPSNNEDLQQPDMYQNPETLVCLGGIALWSLPTERILTFLLELLRLPCSWFNIGSHFILGDMDITPCYKISATVKLLLPLKNLPLFHCNGKLVVSGSEVTYNPPWQQLQMYESQNTLCRRIRRSLKK
jgi:hypothetical protein